MTKDKNICWNKIFDKIGSLIIIIKRKPIMWSAGNMFEIRSSDAVCFSVQYPSIYCTFVISLIFTLTQWLSTLRALSLSDVILSFKPVQSSCWSPPFTLCNHCRYCTDVCLYACRFHDEVWLGAWLSRRWRKESPYWHKNWSKFRATVCLCY